MLKEVKNLWKQYRYRFTPWQALNFDRHAVPLTDQHHDTHLDIQDGKLLNDLELLFSKFRAPEYAWMFRDSPKRREEFQLCNASNKDILHSQWGFELTLEPSGIPGAGKGVFVKRGSIQKGQIVALYPGTVYLSHQPIL